MNTRGLKIINILLWGGTGLILLTMALSYNTFAPYLETLWYTPKIPIAPALAAAAPAEGAGMPLMPFEGETAPGVLEVALAQPATATPTPEPTRYVISETFVTLTPTPVHRGAYPERVRIPAIDLDAPVVSISWQTTEVDGTAQAIWQVPDWRAVGWHDTSALVGMPGNTVLNGHNTSKGEVFRDLYKVEVGSNVFVEADDGQSYSYVVREKYILPEAGQPLEVRIQNAQYIQPTTDERLTLVTCHPYGSVANRLLLIAYPAVRETSGN